MPGSQKQIHRLDRTEGVPLLARNRTSRATVSALQLAITIMIVEGLVSSGIRCGLLPSVQRIQYDKNDKNHKRRARSALKTIHGVEKETINSAVPLEDAQGGGFAAVWQPHDKLLRKVPERVYSECGPDAAGELHHERQEHANQENVQRKERVETKDLHIENVVEDKQHTAHRCGNLDGIALF